MLKKILIIEDEADQIMVLKTRLEANDFSVISATDGGEGLKKVYRDKPDMIILDVLMPNIDGIEVCKSLKKDPETKSIPIIIITAAGLKDIENMCATAGADGCIRKPYDSTELVKKIKTLLHLES